MNTFHDGVTVIVLSFERLKSLKLMLESLLAQDLHGIKVELIVCNNSSRVHLKRTPFSALGRVLQSFSGIKIINVDYSWRTAIRYALATLAKYDTVLFLDDDLILQKQDFIAYMFENYKTLRSVDLLSCWNRLWVEWNENSLSTVSLTFRVRGITDLTKCDVAGPGICMFNKRILTPKVLNVVMNPEFPKAYDMGFSLIASLEHGSECFFLPSFEMLENHEQSRQTPLLACPEDYLDLHALFKSLLEQGYKPVLSRQSSLESTSPERRAIELLVPRSRSW